MGNYQASALITSDRWKAHQLGRARTGRCWWWWHSRGFEEFIPHHTASRTPAAPSEPPPTAATAASAAAATSAISAASASTSLNVPGNCTGHEKNLWRRSCTSSSQGHISHIRVYRRDSE